MNTTSSALVAVTMTFTMYHRKKANGFGNKFSFREDDGRGHIEHSHPMNDEDAHDTFNGRVVGWLVEGWTVIVLDEKDPTEPCNWKRMATATKMLPAEEARMCKGCYADGCHKRKED